MVQLYDDRLPVIKRIITGIISKSDLKYSNAMITNDNNLVIITRDTVFHKVQMNELLVGEPLAFYCGNFETLEENCCIHDFNLLNYISSIYNLYINQININTLVASDNNLKDNENFQYYLSLKASDGMRFYKLNGNNLNNTFMIPIFSGFPNIAKSDKLGINVYSLIDGYLLIEMIIFKKKINKEIKMYYKTINIV